MISNKTLLHPDVSVLVLALTSWVNNPYQSVSIHSKLANSHYLEDIETLTLPQKVKNLEKEKWEYHNDQILADSADALDVVSYNKFRILGSAIDSGAGINDPHDIIINTKEPIKNVRCI